jgi:hypothetical protein
MVDHCGRKGRKFEGQGGDVRWKRVLGYEEVQ